MPPIDPQSLDRLYRQQAPALRLYARQWLGGGGEDLVHDAFVRLAQQRSPPDRVVPWLFRVVRNAALMANRTAARRQKREAAAGNTDPWFAPGADPLEADEAARMLAELPLDQREVIVARIWGGLTFEEIARLTGTALPSAYRRYHAGLAQLRERLEGRWPLTNQNPTT